MIMAIRRSWCASISKYDKATPILTWFKEPGNGDELVIYTTHHIPNIDTDTHYILHN